MVKVKVYGWSSFFWVQNYTYFSKQDIENHTISLQMACKFIAPGRKKHYAKTQETLQIVQNAQEKTQILFYLYQNRVTNRKNKGI